MPFKAIFIFFNSKSQDYTQKKGFSSLFRRFHMLFHWIHE